MNMQKGIQSFYNSRHDQSTMGIDPMNNISNNNKNTLCSYIISTNLTLYKQIIGSLMYLVNTRSDLSFVVNILSQFMVESEVCVLGGCETCVDISAQDNRVRIEIYL
jgi:hypothetical protein